MILVSSPQFGGHVPPSGHPERLERAEVFDRVAERFRAGGGTVLDPRAATRDELARVHGAAMLDEVAATAGRAVMLDPDTFTSPESHGVALLAAGGSIVAVDRALDERQPAMALVRPPGHHAERDRAMGFCLYNNVAVAAAHALSRGLARVAIVDIDVHHGNGTQWIFYDDPRVLYVSTHQFPFYPGTGAADETGAGKGTGYTVNIPLEAGATTADYWRVYSTIVAPVLQQFQPELLLISAGFDAHEDDPLASMRVTTDGYAAIVAALRSWAGTAAVAATTEGGYNLAALEGCVDGAVAALSAPVMAVIELTASEPAPRAERALKTVRAAQSTFWRGL
jgi:acetoin utilization deacetylase AcuC-like enzyme